MDVITFVGIAVIFVTVHGKQAQQFQRIMDDQLVGGSYYKLDGIRSRLECGVICEKEDCGVFSFHPQTQECFIYQQTSPEISPYPGLLTFSVSKRLGVCADNTYSLYKELDLCLKVYDNNKMTWKSANLHCELNGGRLLVIKQFVETMTALGHLSLSGKYYWIGARSVSGSMTWIDGSSVETGIWKDLNCVGDNCCLSYDFVNVRLASGECSPFTTSFVCEKSIV